MESDNSDPSHDVTYGIDDIAELIQCERPQRLGRDVITAGERKYCLHRGIIVREGGVTRPSYRPIVRKNAGHVPTVNSTKAFASSVRSGLSWTFSIPL